VWCERAGGEAADFVYDVAVSDAGDAIFIAGEFWGSATFGTGGNAVEVVSAGDSDMFVARYDIAGELEWVARGGGVSIDRAIQVEYDEVNDEVVVQSWGFGHESVYASAGRGPSMAVTLDEETVLKTCYLADDGLLRAATPMALNVGVADMGLCPGEGDHEITAQKYKAETTFGGHSYSVITGAFEGRLNLGAISLGESGSNNGDRKEFYLARYPDPDPANQWPVSLDPVWAVCADGSGNDWGNAVAIIPDPVSGEPDKVVAVGCFHEQIDFIGGGSLLAEGNDPDLGSLSDIFIVVYEFD